MEIDGFDYVIGAVDILVTYDLHCGLLRDFVFLDEYGRNILIDVLRQNSLYYYQTFVALAGFYYTQVINFAVSVQIKIVDACVVVEGALELFEVAALSENCGYGFEVEVLTDVLALCANGDGLIRQQRCAAY